MKKLLVRLNRRLKVGRNLAKQNKWVAVFMTVFSLLLTLLFVRIMRASTEPTDIELPLLESVLEGKNAITLSLKIENIPLELLYPGVMVDIIKKEYGKVSSVAENVPVAGITIIDSETVRLVLGVNSGDEKKILNSDSKELFAVVVGKKERKKVEIISVN